MRLFWICLGGAAGTAARYLLGGWLARRLGSAFPYGTLAVNLIGSSSASPPAPSASGRRGSDSAVELDPRLAVELGHRHREQEGLVAVEAVQAVRLDQGDAVVVALPLEREVEPVEAPAGGEGDSVGVGEERVQAGVRLRRLLERGAEAELRPAGDRPAQAEPVGQRVVVRPLEHVVERRIVDEADPDAVERAPFGPAEVERGLEAGARSDREAERRRGGELDLARDRQVAVERQGGHDALVELRVAGEDLG